jgi:hypothetical protein
LVASVLATVVVISDYVQFASNAYQQFSAKIEEQSIDHKTIESIETNISVMNNLLSRQNEMKK